MLFNSSDFFIFLAAVLALYYALPHRAQNRMLLVASYIFYGAWDWRFLGLILLSTVVDYVVALAIEASADPRRRWRLLTVSLCVNLGILAIFKYLGFFTENLAALAGLAGITLSPLTIDVVLPVGISFYTFQTMSYTIDVYRREFPATRSFLDFALYVSFFPQLVAGPIERAGRLLPQITQPRTVTAEGCSAGGWLILWGLSKKVVIADNLTILVDQVYAPEASPTFIEVIAATYAFAIQIYCDFAGYSDIARGVARLLGFELVLNFNLPYFAVDPSDLWRRWHISLGHWIRDYVHVPLAQRSHTAGQAYRNMIVVMVLIGLWHGAGWNFIFWGAFHGCLLALYRAGNPLLRRVRPRTRAGRAAWWGSRVGVLLVFDMIGYTFFRSAGFTQIVELYRAPMAIGMAGEWLLPLAALTVPLWVMQGIEHATGDLEIARRLPVPIRALLYAALVLSLALLAPDAHVPFIYFQF